MVMLTVALGGGGGGGRGARGVRLTVETPPAPRTSPPLPTPALTVPRLSLETGGGNAAESLSEVAKRLNAENAFLKIEIERLEADSPKLQKLEHDNKDLKRETDPPPSPPAPVPTITSAPTTCSQHDSIDANAVFDSTQESTFSVIYIKLEKVNAQGCVSGLACRAVSRGMAGVSGPLTSLLPPPTAFLCL